MHLKVFVQIKILILIFLRLFCEEESEKNGEKELTSVSCHEDESIEKIDGTINFATAKIISVALVVDRNLTED